MVFSYKFAAYFQSTFLQEYLWRTTSVKSSYDHWNLWYMINLEHIIINNSSDSNRIQTHNYLGQFD